MKNLLIVFIVLGVLGGGGYMLLKKSPPEMDSFSVMPTQKREVQLETTASQEMMPTGTSGMMNEETTQESRMVKKFAVEGGMFYFNLKEITVQKGDTVKITLTSKEGLHDFVLDEFNAKTKQINSGETDSVTFVADKTGTFEYYCSVGSHRAMGMKGNLIVK